MSKTLEKVVNHSERLYPDIAPRRGRDDHFARYEFVKQFVRGKTVADIGCGEGYGADIIRTAGAKGVIGLELDAESVITARKKYPGIEFVVGDATKTGLLDASVDIVVSFEVWHHLDDYEKFITEMRRILKPGGKLIVSVPNRHIIYLNPFHRHMLTEFYRTDVDKEIIEKYLKGYFVVDKWFGQRFVRLIYANPPVRFLLWLLSFTNKNIAERIGRAFRLANGPMVLPLTQNNARILIFIAHTT